MSVFARAMIEVLDFLTDEDRQLYIVLGTLSLLSLVILGIDIYEVSTGTVDFNRHIPFFVPVVQWVFIGMLIWMQRLTSAHKSHYAPKNIPVERADEGRAE